MKRNEVLVDTDSKANRKRTGRAALLIAVILISIVAPTLFGMYVGALIPFSGSKFFFGWIGLTFGIAGVMKVFPHFWVVVPQTSAFVTTMIFGKSKEDPNVPYGPGGHPAYPWEMREESGNITLDIFTIPFKETVPTKDTAVIVDGKVQFKFSLEHINKVIGIDESTIEGFIAQVNEYISDTLSECKGDEAKNQVKELRSKLETEFEGKTETAKNLLDEYGIMVTGFQISSIDFPPKVQEVRDTIEEAKLMRKAVLKQLGFRSEKALRDAIATGAMTEKAVERATNQILAASNNIQMEVKRIDASGFENAGEGGKIAGSVLAGSGGKK